MKRTYRLLLFATITVIALVIGSLVFRQVEMRPYTEPLPTPSPTSQSTPDINVTMGAEAALLSQAVGNALQETANAAEGTKIAPNATASPTLCPYNDGSLNCPGGMETLSPQQRIVMLMASATETEFNRLALTATALTTDVTATQQSLTASPTLCPWSDVIVDCPGGYATLSPQQQIVMLMASAEGSMLYRYSLTATALGPAATPTPTPTSRVTHTPCAFMWAHQDLPDVAQAARDALSTISIAPFQVIRADAYGESCGTSFGAMTTDFYLSVEVNGLSDNTYLAQIVKTAYTVLTELKIKLPAAPGYLDIQFTAGGSTKHFRAMFSQIKAVLDDGKDSASLVEIGGIH